MGLESVFRLSLIMNMVDNLTSPMSRVTSSVGSSVSKMESMNQTMGNMAVAGTAMAGVGKEITDAVLEPVGATFETKRALGELASVGVENLQAVEDAATQFSNTWAGTTKSEFITAAYDIKSGISSLSDEGVAGYTEMAGITATATKSTVAEMTNLFATGYGIYKDYYGDMSDVAFGEMLSSGIAASVENFKTTGSDMAQAMSTLGASATAAQVPMEEQLAIMGMLQATMSGGEAGTKYKAFLRDAAKGGEALGLSILDANNNLLSMPEVMSQLQGKFGDTMDAAEKMELQKAFGSAESVALIELMYNKTDDLQGNILSMYSSMSSGMGTVTAMANEINTVESSQFEILQQKSNNLKEQLGNSLLPTIMEFIDKASETTTKLTTWAENNQGLVQGLMLTVLALGAFLTVTGTTMAVVGSLGLVFSKTMGFARGFKNVVLMLPDGLRTVRLWGMYAGDGVSKGFSLIKSGGATAIKSIGRVSSSVLRMSKNMLVAGLNGAKSMATGLFGMAKQAVVTASTALPGLIVSTWAWTAALLANPVTWIVIGIVALIAAIILLWKNWDSVVAWIQNAWNTFVEKIKAGFDWITNLFSGMPVWLQVALAVFMPFIGIPLLLREHWGTITEFFGNLWTGIKTKFKEGIDNIKNFINGVPEWFRESGKKIITTFTEGIKSAINAPKEALSGALAKARELLPFSDAKVGPFSDLTLSGSRVMTTFSTGINQEGDSAAQAVEQNLAKADMSGVKTGVKKVSLTKTETTEKTVESESSDKGNGGVSINNLHLNIDLNKIKDLNKLFKLIKELEDVANGDGYEMPEGSFA